ncbi:MAG: DUF6067 family protein [Ignavibacteriales bacterium]|nr:DUF6067 family protein [Ignavibacteriales bacterium]
MKRNRRFRRLLGRQRRPLHSSSASIGAGPAREREPGDSEQYGVGSWDPESGLGNHRVVVRVEAPAAAVPAMPDRASAEASRRRSDRPCPRPLGWRLTGGRRDTDPEKKNVIVIDASTGERIIKVLPVRIGREGAEFLFEPKTVPGDYYFYYLPYKSEGRKNYPNVKYDPPEWSTDPGLAARAAGLVSSDPATAARASDNLLRAEVIEFQSADAFSAFTPMERIATAAETDALLAAHPGTPYLLFPEDRSFSIRMTGDVPGRWAASGPPGIFRGVAARGEYFTYQIGLWAARQAVSDLDVEFSDLVLSVDGAGNGDGAPVTTIPAKDMTCFNEGGVDWDGSPLVKAVPVGLGQVQALWCGVPVPFGARPGVYKGTATVAPAGMPETILGIELEVTGEVLDDRGDGDPFRMTRLRWLDSTAGPGRRRRPAVHASRDREIHGELPRAVAGHRPRRLPGPHPELFRARR